MSQDIQPTALQADEKAAAKQVARSKSARKKAEIRRRRNRARRLTLMVLLTLAAVALGLYSVTQVWYTTSIPNVTVVDRTLHTVENVSATGSITGWGLTHQGVAAPIETMGDNLLGATTPSGVLGLIQPAAFLLALGIFALVGGMMKQGFVTGIGLICGFFSWNQLVALRGVMEDPNFGGSFNAPGPGLMWFQAALAVSVMLLALVTLQVVLVNSERRRKERERAKEAGEAVMPTFLEVIHAMTLSQLARTSSVPSTVTTAHDDAAKSHLQKEKAHSKS